METVAEYINNYHKKLSEFLAEFEANEIDFIEKELTFLKHEFSKLQVNAFINKLYQSDINDIDPLDFNNPIKEIFTHGNPKRYYLLKKNIEFLEAKKIALNDTSNSKKNRKPNQKGKKPYKSFTRALAIYFILRGEQGVKIPDSKKEIYELVADWQNPETGNPVGKDSFYQTYYTGKDGNKGIYTQSPKKLKELYPLDYQYALTLLNPK